ncbi:hypothetical protein [Streptomyces longisporoflavus]|uniref:hypothetical protein n=1 Tax=Streptomyces longisporoflavus TaxID=28044 RepID=UPI001E38DA1F|nr:hypothetical protein [Streptomyces longisporoflavus]
MSLLGRAAEAGCLRVPVEQAARVIHAATTGATLALIGEAPSERDLTTSARLRDTVIASSVHWWVPEGSLSGQASW